MVHVQAQCPGSHSASKSGRVQDQRLLYKKLFI
jgi:hypothetical protein